jgi:transcription elongation factor Elf1
MEHPQDKRLRGRTGKAFPAGGMPLQYERWITCPYCGEAIISVVDGSAGTQSYIEDCEVCCRPILLQAEIDSDGNLLDIITRREDD